MRALKRFKYTILLFLLAGQLSCQQSEKASIQKIGSREPQNKRIKVLTTIAPLYSFTKNITGDAADVQNLLPSGVGPHEYALSPENALKISQARIIIKNGAGLETWLDKLILRQFPDNEKKPVIVDSSAGVNIINANPHVWLSPRNVIAQVRNITGALMKADPAKSEIYNAKAAEYLKRIEALDREISRSVASFSRKEFVAMHSAFTYFAKDYGLREVAVIQESPEKEPTPQHIADVIKAIKTNNIIAVFSEPMVSSKVLDSLARDLGLRVYSLDTLETGALSPEWYENRMRANLEVLKTALDR